MVSMNYKVLEVRDGKEYVFSSHAFKQRIKTFLETSQFKTLEALFEDIASKAHVTADAVRNWNYAKNGPGDIEIVKILADYLNVDYKEIMRVQEVKKMAENKSETLNTDKTKDVIRAVYQKMADFMDVALYEVDFEECGDSYYEYEAMYREMLNLLHRSMLDIPEKLYHQLEEMIVDKFAPYLYGYDFGMTSFWESEEFKEFSMTNGMGFAIDKHMAMEAEAEDFYKKMRVILEEYIVA